MSDGVNVDFGLLQKPDFLGDYVNAFNVGRSLAQQQGEQQAGSLYASDPQAGAAAMMQYDPQKGLALQQGATQQTDQAARSKAGVALAGGDYAGAAQALGPTGDLSAISQLNDQQKQVALQKTEALGAVLHGLSTMRLPDGSPDIPGRLQAAQHIAQQSGLLDPTKITPDDVSDQGLASHAATLAAVERAAMTPPERAEANKPQVIAPGDRLLFGPDASGDAGTGAVAPGAAGGSPTAGAPVQASPDDRLAMARAIYTEAGGEPAVGQAAVGHVILNRLSSGYGGAKSIGEVVGAPGQFEGMTTPRANIAADDPRLQPYLGVADQVIGGQTPDPTGGATQFLNPVLQEKLGRPQPAWATGNGLRIGNHVFYGGQGGNTAPYQVASNGATPAPPSGVQAGGAPPSQPGLPSGYRLVDPGGNDGADTHGHVSTPAELKAAGLPPTAQAWTDPKGEIKPMPQGLVDQTSAVGANDPNKPTGIAFLNTLDPQTRALVLAYDRGAAPLPTGAALRNPVIARAFAATAQYDPSFDGTTYAARAAGRRAFTSGPAAANITAANTALDHMATLDAAIDGLKNGPLQAGNVVGNAFSGAIGQPAVTNFNAAKAAVSSELARVFQGGSPHETEIQNWNKQLDAANSPAQLHGVVREMASLLASRVNELGGQYNQAMGRTQDGLTLLRPDAAGTLARLSGQDGNRAIAKAAFYQQAERNGMPPPEIDTAWTRYDAQRSAMASHAAKAGTPPRVLNYNPQTGGLE